MRWYDKLEEGLLALLLAGMTVLTFVQVVARYVFNYSFVWAMELTGVLFAWLIFVGMSYGVRVGAHIGIDVITRRLGQGTARVVGIVAAALCFVYACILAYGGWNLMTRIKEVGILMQDLPIEQWIPRVVLPVGFALLALRFLHIFWRLATGQSAHLLGDEAEDALKMQDELSESQP
ncbi:TRAP transporter small permease [Ottowia sp.]|uniref:TRAP transporter small permease n=1 Tax=Ottowia sp. TaxID=1898956 RepID=UPI002D17206B|nr:TRAP transporter small permease [Ottowia sp.]HRN74770.1 TRAP transporter small permease [Ottowia sp.]HRQ01922.1 TRAP transporter small permease [Ottowia sp.]